MKVTRVLVADDSAFMRKMVSEILASDKRIEVIGSAKNGEEALKKVKELKPDVLTLDIEMPVMDGITALGHLMKETPLPVIMVSSLTKKSADWTIKALELGAVDFITKPSGGISLDIEKVSDEIITKVLTAASSKVAPSSKKVNREDEKKTSKQTIVAIGTSTGGPKALQQVIPLLAANFPAPIVVVQHMPKGFTQSLAKRLDSFSSITVKEAEDGDLLENGTAYIAPGGSHLTIKQVGKKFFAQITTEGSESGHRPSVDVLYRSLAELKNVRILPVIMTGMGADGSKGLLFLKSKKPDTFAISESESTSIIYGMPQAAKNTGCIDREADLSEISTIMTDSIK